MEEGIPHRSQNEASRRVASRQARLKAQPQAVDSWNEYFRTEKPLKFEASGVAFEEGKASTHIEIEIGLKENIFKDLGAKSEARRGFGVEAHDPGEGEISSHGVFSGEGWDVVEAERGAGGKLVIEAYAQTASEIFGVGTLAEKGCENYGQGHRGEKGLEKTHIIRILLNNRTRNQRIPNDHSR